MPFVHFATVARLALAVVAVSVAPSAHAGIDDCLKTAVSTVNPDDLKKAANFAAQHPQCLSNLVPPTLVPYTALSGSVDVANQSGALGKVGLGFSTYGQCRDKLDPGKQSLKALSPVLKPVCGMAGMSCASLEGAAADEINSQATQQVPMLSLLPCACAAATSGLGVERMMSLLKSAEQCGNTLEEVGEALGDAAKGVYKGGEAAVDLGKKSADTAVKLVGELGKVLESLGCALGVGKVFGGCEVTAVTVGNKFCKAHGGTVGVYSNSNKPNDYDVVCKDQTACSIKPGKAPECFNIAEVNAKWEAHLKKQEEMLAFNQGWCASRRDVLIGRHYPRCRDNGCRAATGLVLASFNAECAQSIHHGANWTALFGGPYFTQVEKLVKESVLRDPGATAADRLGYQLCRPFMGREGQFLCEHNEGFKACAELAAAPGQSYAGSKVTHCRRVGNPAMVYPPPEARVPDRPISSLPSMSKLPEAAASAAPPVLRRIQPPPSPAR
jgi:hypothetical protein